MLDAAAARHIDNPESGMRGHISWYEIDSQRCRVRQGTLGLI